MISFVLVCVTICCVYRKQGTKCVDSTFTLSETRVHVQKAQLSQACQHQWRNRCSAPPHTCPSHLRWFEDGQGYQSFALSQEMPGSASVRDKYVERSYVVRVQL